MAYAKGKWGFYLLTSLGALSSIGWLVTFILTADSMMTMAFSTLLTMVTIGLLWKARHQASETFWRLLAAGWSVGLLTNLGWGIHEMLTGQDLTAFSWVDVMYIGRNVLVWIALWHYDDQAARRRKASVIATACAAIALAWLLVYRPTLSQSPLTSQRIGIFTSVAVYPVMDVGLIYAATIAWVGAAGGIPRRTMGLFCLSTAAYGVANCLQFGNLVLDGFSTPLTNLFWVLSDVMASLAAAYVLGRASSVSEPRRRTSPLMLWLDRVPYAFVFIATGLTVMDLVIHRGRIDIVATLSILLASATLALQHWWNQSHN